MIAVLAGCAAPPRARIEALRPPQDLLQLIEAIWRVNESGLILRDEFYTVDNLKRAFGGSNVELQVGKYDVMIGSFRGEISEFPSWMPPQATDPLDFRRLTIHPDGGLKASIILRLHGTDIHRDMIEKRFGKNWQEPPFVLPPHPVMRAPRIHPDEDKTIIYLSGDAQSGWEVSFSFGRDGSLGSMRAEAHRTKR